MTDLPCPAVKRGHLLIRTTTTLISPGTERMLVSFGQASLLGKARAQPERLREALQKVRTDGLMPTVEAILNKLDRPIPLGYSNVGVVLEVGEEVTGFAVGDRVVSTGGHAEVVNVPKNLCATIPADVSDEAAAFAVTGAIALEGLRLAEPTLGEAIVVTGLGLIGLLTVQLLKAQGCRVLGVDYDGERVALARKFGADVVNLTDGGDPVEAARVFSRGRGIDAAIITTATASSEPVHHAALMCRKRGRIVLVGVSGLELSRADFYEKELSFQVSCSYGPGRYDLTYEQEGIDYPAGFVRWTAQRNVEAFLDMAAARKVDTELLISHRFPVTQAEAAYELIVSGEPSLGVLLTYPTPSERTDAELRAHTIELNPPRARALDRRPCLGFIGAGNHATGMLLPAFRSAQARLRVVASTGGVSSMHAGRKFGFEKATTDVEGVLADPEIDAVVIATRHDSHAKLAQSALLAAKHVFVEKPLALSAAELDAIRTTYEARPDRILMVGFNRRFAPHVRRLKTLLAGVRGPKAFVMTVNAGSVPPDHWTQDPRAGGGRIVGEACHFIDLLRFLAGSRIGGFEASRVAPNADTASITLRFEDGSIGTILYLTTGHRSFPKERLEVFAAGRVLQLDNFRRLRGFGWPGFSKMNLWRQDKGERQCAAEFIRAVREGGPAPIPFEELMEVSGVTLAVATRLQ